MEFLLTIIGWLLFSVIIGVVGSNRKIGFAGAFFLSLLLSPFIGLIITLVSKSKSDIEYQEQLLRTQKQQQESLEKISSQKTISDVTSELKKIKELLDSGVINQEEFDNMKNRLIKSVDKPVDLKEADAVKSSKRKFNSAIYFDGKLEIPQIVSTNNNKIRFADREITEVIKGVEGKYFIVSQYGRHYYKSYDSAVKASYILRKTNKLSIVDLDEE